MKKCFKIILASTFLSIFGVSIYRVVQEQNYIDKIPTKYLLNGSLDTANIDSVFDYYLLSDSNNEYDGKYAVSLKEGVDKGNYQIPSKYNNIDVIGIYRQGFAFKNDITVTIPDTIKVIDYEAFFKTSFTNTNMTIPYTVEKIGTAAFFSSNLKDVTFSDGYDSSMGVCSTAETTEDDETKKTSSQLTEIPDFCFAKCKSLASITFSNSLRSIKDEAFEYCSSLKTIAFLGGLENISSRAFNCCSNLSQVYLPNSLITSGTIEDFAFSHCNSKLSFQISSTEDEYNTFKTNHTGWNRKSEFTTNYYTDLSIKKGDVYANGTWLYNLQTIDSVQSVNIMKYIGELNSDGIIAFPDKINGVNVTTISTDCISEYQESIKRIYFPLHLTELPNSFFDDNYKNLTYIGSMSGNNCYDSSTISEIKTIDLSKMTDLHTIGEKAFGKPGFCGKDKFDTLKLPCNLEKIGKDAFLNQDYIKNFSIEGNRTNTNDLEIRENAFKGLGSNYKDEILTNDIVLPKETTLIGESAFEDADCISSLKIEGNLNGDSSAKELSINKKAFYACQNLQKVIIEDRYTGSGYKTITLNEQCFAFDSNENLDYSYKPHLQFVYLPNGVKANSTKQFNRQYRASIYFGGTALTLSNTFAFDEQVSQTTDGFSYYNAVSATKFNFNYSIPTYSNVKYPGLSSSSSTKVLYDTSEFTYLINSSDDTASVTKYHFDARDISSFTQVGTSNNYKKTVTVPESISYDGESYSITEIGDGAFAHSDSYEFKYNDKSKADSSYRTISRVSLPSSVKKIGDYAFFRCVGLEGSFEMPSSLESIGYLAFAFTGIESVTSLNSDCNFLENESSIQSNYSKPSPFLNCPNLASISLEDKEMRVLVTDAKQLKDNSNNVWVVFPNSSTTDKKFSFSSSTNKFHFGAFKTVKWINELTISSSNMTTDEEQAFFLGYCSQQEIRKNLCMKTSVNNLVNNASPLSTNMSDSMTLILKYDEAENLNIPNGAFYKSNIKRIRIPYGGGIGYIPKNFLNNIQVPNEGIILQVETNKEGTAWTNKEEKKNYLDFTNTGYTFVNNQAFYNSTFLTEVNLGSVTSVGDMAFYGNTNLTTVLCPNVTSIGKQAFYNNTNLTNISCPEVTTIDDMAFQNDKSLTTITFPKVQTLNQQAFNECRNLQNVKFPNTLTSIGQSCFEYAGLTSTKDNPLVIPSSVITLGNRAFRECNNLVAVKFEEGSSLTSIPEFCFDNCDRLSSVILPENLTKIDKVAFWGCAFESIELDSSKNNLVIGNKAFENCKSLTTISIKESENVVDFLDEAFKGCVRLNNLELKNCAKISMGKHVFQGCTSLTNVTIGDVDIKLWDSEFEGCPISSLTIEASSTNIPLYLGNGVFKDCVNLTELDFSKRPVWIGKISDLNGKITSGMQSGFQGCTSLIKVTFGDFDSNNYIGADAFNGCTSLNSVTWGSTIDYIGQRAFDNTSLTDVDLSNCTSLTSLNGFSNCTKLNSFIYPTSITSIGESCFSGSSKLKTVKCSSDTSSDMVLLSSSISSIGNEAFKGCSCIVIVKSSYTSSLTLGNNVFSNCTSLKLFSQDTKGSLSYGSDIFSGDTSLMVVILPSNFNKNSSTKMFSQLTQFSSSGSGVVCFAKGASYQSFTSTPDWMKINSTDIIRIAYYKGTVSSSYASDYHEWEWNDDTSIKYYETPSSSSSIRPTFISTMNFCQKF